LYAKKVVALIAKKAAPIILARIADSSKLKKSVNIFGKNIKRIAMHMPITKCIRNQICRFLGTFFFMVLLIIISIKI